MKRSIDHCSICGERGEVVYKDVEDYFFGSPGKWNLCYSPKCCLYWLSPRPGDSEIHKIYNNYYTHLRPSKKIKAIKQLKTKIKLTLLKTYCGYKPQKDNSKQKTIPILTPALKQYALRSFGWLEGPHNTGKLLDIGCGNGEFLHRMKGLGWHVTGLELDIKSAKMARDHFGIEVFEDALEDVVFSDCSYDAVTMNHVIEHLADPLSVLKECHRILSIGGQIVITTPNAKSLGHRIFKRFWRGLEFPRHFYIYTPKSLRHSMEKAGFKVVSTKTLSRSARWIWLVSSKVKKGLWPLQDNNKDEEYFLKILGRFFQFIETLFSLFSPVGEELLIVAKKEIRQKVDRSNY